MRYLRYLHDGRVFAGLLTEGEKIRELKGDIFGPHELGRDLLDLEEVTLLAPLAPGKVVCAGLNYRSHAAEMGMVLPEDPVVFLKPPSAIIGPGAPIVYPKASRHLEFEGELAVVIGRRSKGVSPEEARGSIFGYTCANDVTARDLQRSDGQWTRAKGFDTFLPLGPWVVTENVAPWRLTTKVNGQGRQDESSVAMIFTIEQIISYISGIMTLNPGDLVLTGTPDGTGPLAPGDLVVVAISGIGRLVNPIIQQE